MSVDERRLFYGRGRGVGGSSATNGGVALRAEPEDFATWPARVAVARAAPVLLPLRARPRLRRRSTTTATTARSRSCAGPAPSGCRSRSAFHDACTSLGFAACADHNAPGSTGVGPIPMNRVERMRISNALAYLEPARGRANLERARRRARAPHRARQRSRHGCRARRRRAHRRGRGDPRRGRDPGPAPALALGHRARRSASRARHRAGARPPRQSART